jgi:hypothetical protein
MIVRPPSGPVHCLGGSATGKTGNMVGPRVPGNLADLARINAELMRCSNGPARVTFGATSMKALVCAAKPGRANRWKSGQGGVAAPEAFAKGHATRQRSDEHEG